MNKTFEIQITTQYRGSESVWIEAMSATEALKKIRRKAELEGWFDRRNDGYVSFKTVKG